MTASNPRIPPLPTDHPHLRAARQRLRRTQWTWAILCTTVGGLSLIVALRLGGEIQLIIAAVPWLASGALLGFGSQPAALALVAAQFALSLVLLLPGAAAAFGADPVAAVFGATGVEAAFIGLIRAVLAVTAWSQFHFYRILYGTASSSGLDPRLPAIPEVVPNRSNSFAAASRALGALALLAALSAFGLAGNDLGLYALGAGHAMSVLAMGLGLGAAFSPTTQRPSALTGIALGGLAFLAAVAAGRFLIS
jgi:hypothetical protein